MNLAVADSRVATLTKAMKTLCVDKFLDGERSEMLPPEMARLPEPFILDEHLDKLLEGLDPNAAAGEVKEKEGVEWLPDVAFSHVGMKQRDNEYQVPLLPPFRPLSWHITSNQWQALLHALPGVPALRRPCRGDGVVCMSLLLYFLFDIDMKAR